MKVYPYLFFLGILFLGLTACGDSSEDTQTDTGSGSITKVKITQASVSDGPQEYRFTGQVEAYDFTSLSTRIMGKITYLNLKEGDAVQAGQVLFQIKSADIQAGIAQSKARIREAEAALKNIETNYMRIQNLYQKKSATRKELDDMQAQFDMAKAQLESARQSRIASQEMLSYASISAPFEGVVVKKYAHQGDLAKPGQPILDIEGQGTFKVLAKVPENEINLFEKGDSVRINIEALGNKVLQGQVQQINPSSSQSQGQFEVSIQIQADEQSLMALKSGLFAEVILAKGKNEQLKVAENLLIKRGQLQGLFTVNQENQAMLRWVRTGRSSQGQVEILSGLAPGERYISHYEGKLQDGQKIQVIQ